MEEPLLHAPDLALVLLKVAGPSAARIEDAAEVLSGYRLLAHEAASAGDPEVLAMLGVMLRHLVAARLVDTFDDGWFRITPRGRAVLDRCPDGVDDSVLMEFPEFRAWLDRTHGARPVEDARLHDFLRGGVAFDQGRALTDNPHAPETAQHLAWEDGWLEADRRGREEK